MSNLKDEIKWVFSTRLEEENAQEFVSRLPDIIFYAKSAYEESKDYLEAKRIFYEARRAGIIRRYKESDNPETRKSPEYLLDAICDEELVGEKIELWEWASLVEQQANTVDSLKEKLWSAKKTLEKRVEV